VIVDLEEIFHLWRDGTEGHDEIQKIFEARSAPLFGELGECVEDTLVWELILSDLRIAILERAIEVIEMPDSRPEGMRDSKEQGRGHTCIFF
jgi:hypothetical protein